MTWKSSSCFSAFSSGSVLSRTVLASSMSFCACSRLFQKLSAAIRELISPRRFWAWGTSKKPPQMAKFVGCGGQFSFNGIEHCAKGTPRQLDPQGSLHGYMVTWLHGYMVTWLHGYMVTW